MRKMEVITLFGTRGDRHPELLKGVPVKPTDDVDVEKEYQLIPIDSL